MGRHRDTRAGTRPVLLTSGGQVRSHRRPPGVARARAVSLVAVGALAGGIAIASTTVPWSREASHLQPETRPSGPSGGAGAGPGVLPVLPMPPPATEEPVESAAVPALAPPCRLCRPASPPALAEPPASAVWRADGPGAFLANVVEHRRGRAAPGERRRGVLPADRRADSAASSSPRCPPCTKETSTTSPSRCGWTASSPRAPRLARSSPGGRTTARGRRRSTFA